MAPFGGITAPYGALGAHVAPWGQKGPGALWGPGAPLGPRAYIGKLPINRTGGVYVKGHWQPYGLLIGGPQGVGAGALALLQLAASVEPTLLPARL